MPLNLGPDLLPVLIAVLVFSRIFAFYTAVVTGDKGYSYMLWWLGGFFFGPIALLAAVGLPDRMDRRSR